MKFEKSKKRKISRKLFDSNSKALLQEVHETKIVNE